MDENLLSAMYLSKTSFFYADEIPHDVRWPDIQTDAAVVFDRGQFLRLVDLEEGLDIRVFDLAGHARVQEGDVQTYSPRRGLSGNAQRFGDESHRTDAAALAIAPIVHLRRRLEDVLSRHGNGTDEAGDAAAASSSVFGASGGTSPAKLRAGK